MRALVDWKILAFAVLLTAGATLTPAIGSDVADGAIGDRNEAATDPFEPVKIQVSDIKLDMNGAIIFINRYNNFQNEHMTPSRRADLAEMASKLSRTAAKQGR